MSARDREFLDLGSHARTSGFFSVRIIPRARLTGGGSNISRTTAKEHDLGAHTRPRKSKNRFLAHSRRCAGPVGRVPEEANVRGAPPPRAGDGLTGRRQGGAWVAQERAVGKLSLYLSHGESSACALAMTDEHRPPPSLSCHSTEQQSAAGRRRARRLADHRRVRHRSGDPRVTGRRLVRRSVTSLGVAWLWTSDSYQPTIDPAIAPA